MTFTVALLSFAILTMILLANQIFFTYATQGFGYGWSSNRKNEVSFSPLAKRISNAYDNQVASAAYIVPVLAVAAIVGLQDPAAQTAALLVVIGRAAFSVLYYTGIPFVRLLGFLLANLSTLFILYSIFTSGLI